MKGKVIGVIIALLVILAIILIAIPEGDANETIKMGWMGPLTGDGASIGQSIQKGTVMAVEEVNANGGINGKQIEVIYEDSKCNSKDASNAANKLVNLDQVDYIIGGACSSETLAAAPIAEVAGTLLISPVSSSPDVTNAGDYVFRDYPSDSFIGKWAADFAYNELNKRNVAINYCLSDWCVGIAEKFKERFVEVGGEIVAYEAHEQTAKDLKTQLSKTQSANPDLVYFVGYTESSVIGLKQAKEIGIDVQFLGGDTWEDLLIWESVGEAGEGALYVIPSVHVPESWKADFLARPGPKEITIGTPQAYDVVKILAQQIALVGDDPELVKNSLYSMSPYSGVSGVIEFDSNGDLKEASFKAKKVVSGKTVDY